MLVVISDLHLNDGSNGVSLDPGAFDIFAPRLAELAVRASWRSDGRYRPLERIDLVLLGDVLDFTRSRRWLEGSVRPWSDPAASNLLDTSLQIADDILQTNEAALRTLRAIGTEGALRLPQASAAGIPITTNDGQPVPVAIHYMVGNTDWLLHSRAPGFELLRQRVCHALGLVNEHRQPFAHDPAESEELLETLRAHSMLARHGDVFDPLHCGEDRDMSSVGEAIAIELIQRFLLEAETNYAAELSPAVIANLRELDHFRPLALSAVFLEGLLERMGLQAALVKELKRTWDHLAEQLLQMPQLHKRGGLTPIDMVDQLANALLFSRKTALGWSAKIQNWLCGLRGATTSSYYQHALAEADCRNRRAKHVVYGHTHKTETVPLDASYADGFVLQQTYFNAGTWRRMYEPTHAIASGHEFLAADHFSFLAFFQGDERGGRPYETWTGSLGACQEQPLPLMAPSHRPQSAAHAFIRPPHFALPNSSRTNATRR
jgi:UDP-2,3-diacylglucosamine pyrophosphatase LpxH